MTGFYDFNNTDGYSQNTYNYDKLTDATHIHLICNDNSVGNDTKVPKRHSLDDCVKFRLLNHPLHPEPHYG